MPCLPPWVFFFGSSIDATTADGIHATVWRPDRTGVAPVDDETFDGWRVTYRNALGATGLDGGTSRGLHAGWAAASTC
jgi:hypothetical protein